MSATATATGDDQGSPGASALESSGSIKPTGSVFTTLTNSAGLPTATVGAANGTYHSSPVTSALATATGPGGAPAATVSHAAAVGLLVPAGGLFAAFFAAAAAL